MKIIKNNLNSIFFQTYIYTYSAKTNYNQDENQLWKIYSYANSFVKLNEVLVKKYIYQWYKYRKIQSIHQKMRFILCEALINQ